MATQRPTFSLVIRAHTLAPSPFIFMDTTGEPPLCSSKDLRASTMTPPSNGALPSRVVILMACIAKKSPSGFISQYKRALRGIKDLTCGKANIALIADVSFKRA